MTLERLLLALLITLNLKVLVLAKPTDMTKEYIIVLKESSGDKNQILKKRRLRRLHNTIKRLGGKVINDYSLIFLGSHVHLNPSALSTLERQPEIQSISPNGTAYLSDNSTITKSWGLDRVDQYNSKLNGRYTVFNTGKGAHVYIMDSGVRSSHNEFSGRVGDGYSALPDSSKPYHPAYVDCHGHGTHVAGTALGKTSGVARQATLHSVKVFGCEGSTPWSVILIGCEWIMANHKKPAVVNMSFGGEKNEAVNTAVTNMIKAGIHTVNSAGNSNDDACKYSPASTPEAITVAATNPEDERVTPGFWGSNYGACVDLFAPGYSIVSASHKSNGSHATMSGTSMSAPHVTGAVALVLGRFPNMSPGEAQKFMADRALSEKIKKVNGSPISFL